MNHIGSLLPRTNSFSHKTPYAGTIPNNTHTNNNITMTNDDTIGFSLDSLDEDILPAAEPTPLLQKSNSLPAQTSSLSDSQVQDLYKMIEHMETQLSMMKQLLAGKVSTITENTSQYTPVSSAVRSQSAEPVGEVIEGVFTGSEMIDENGKTYPISPNYASKSKLVEGDHLKLTIQNNGAFIYKQIGPIPRTQIKGTLMFDAVKNQWTALAEGRMYKILTASVTFHKGNVSDDVTIIVPESGNSDWAAIEHIIK